MTDYTFQILIGLPLPTGSSIQITFPSTAIPTSTSPTVTGTQNMNSTITGSYDTSTRVLTMTNISPSSGSYVDEGVFIIFVVSSVTNPNTTQTSDGFGYASFDASGNGIEAVTSGTTVTATSGTINSASVTPTVTTIRETTSYTFTFQTSNDVPVGAIIYITFPSTISAADITSTACLSSGTNIDTTALCTITSNRFLTISGGYPSTGVTSSTSISFAVPSITNYDTTQPSDGFGLQTLTSDNYTLDSLSDNVTVTATVGTLSGFTVTTNSSFTGVQNTYTFSMTVSNETILINSYFDITLPSEITVDDTSYSEGT